MKKAFTLLEVIFVITILALLISFFFKNHQNILSFVNYNEHRFEVNEIRSSIKLKNAKKSLKSFDKLNSLDEAIPNKINEKLFSKVLNEPIISSKTNWMKISSNIYTLNIKGEIIKFEYKNRAFNCISKNELCKEFE